MAKKRTIKGRFFVILFLVCFVYAGVLFVVQQDKIAKQAEEMRTLKSQIEQVQGENQKMEHKIEDTNSKEYIEQTAREKLGWVKDGEIRFVEKGSK